MKRARPVLIEWSDSCHVEPGAWVERDVANAASPCGVVTVGWLLEDEGDAYVVASNVTEQGHTSGVFVIPKACALSVARLSPVGPLRSPSPPSRGRRWWSPFGGRR